MTVLSFAVLEELRQGDDTAEVADLRLRVVVDVEYAAGRMHHERVVLTRRWG